MAIKPEWRCKVEVFEPTKFELSWYTSLLWCLHGKLVVYVISTLTFEMFHNATLEQTPIRILNHYQSISISEFDYIHKTKIWTKKDSRNYIKMLQLVIQVILRSIGSDRCLDKSSKNLYSNSQNCNGCLNGGICH